MGKACRLNPSCVIGGLPSLLLLIVVRRRGDFVGATTNRTRTVKRPSVEVVRHASTFVLGSPGDGLERSVDQRLGELGVISGMILSVAVQGVDPQRALARIFGHCHRLVNFSWGGGPAVRARDNAQLAIRLLALPPLPILLRAAWLDLAVADAATVPVLLLTGCGVLDLASGQTGVKDVLVELEGVHDLLPAAHSLTPHYLRTRPSDRLEHSRLDHGLAHLNAQALAHGLLLGLEL